MRVKLEQIADIRTGYTFREAVNRAERGGVPFVQMSDLEDLNQQNISRLKRTNMKIRPDWVLQEGDLLIKARGTDFYPVIVQKELQGAVFTHPLLRLRLNQALALPEFIAWQLSQPKIQKQLLRFAAGTLVQVLNLDAFKELELDLPALRQQQCVQAIQPLIRREEKLLSLLAIKRKQLINKRICQFALNENRIK